MLRLCRLAALAIFFLAAGVLGGCSGAPSDSLIVEEVEKFLLAGDADSIYQVQDIQKTNGRKDKDGTYYADVDYKLRFRIGLRELAQQAKKEVRGLDASIEAAIILEALREEFGAFKAGDVISRKNVFMFHKTEKGWRLFDTEK